MIDWSKNWFDQLPPVWQGGYGSCVECAEVCYGAAMMAHIQGYPLIELSQLYLYRKGGGGAFAMKQLGVCLESLDPRPPWKGIDTSTLAYQIACADALNRQPSPQAVADATNHTVVDVQSFSQLYDGSMADMAVKAMQALDAGYILSAFLPPNHDVCVWGYDPSYQWWIGPDSRSTNAESTHWTFGTVYIQTIIRKVYFKNLALGTKPKPGVTSGPRLPPPPPPTGNTQMLIDAIKTEASALMLGQVTQAQIDELRANVALLVPDVQAPTPTPTPAPLPPGIVHDIGVGGSFVSASGDTWEIAPNPANPTYPIIKRNGTSAAGLYGPRVIELFTGAIKALRNTGSWFLFGANGTWSQTSAP